MTWRAASTDLSEGEARVADCLRRFQEAGRRAEEERLRARADLLRRRQDERLARERRRSTSRKRPTPGPLDATAYRLLAEEGLTLREAGKRIGRSGQRVRTLASRHAGARGAGPGWYAELLAQRREAKWIERAERHRLRQAAKGERLGPVARKLLALLEDGPARVRELYPKAGTSEQSVRICLLGLERRGKVRAERPNERTTIWSLP